ncbi:MAG: hypothetical protein CMQ05_02375 [Gammaproteobacteria bacterium]|nr:hypothetical protein [Gammaproteobacteria bacterium]RPG26199.1 MAG: hypothetical protein CBC10_004835 [Gammaproteobacteria bacterium TMED50]
MGYINGWRQVPRKTVDSLSRRRRGGRAAVGALLPGKGKFAESTLNAVNFGREADSIATITGALAGALHGIEAIPADWIETVDASRGEEPLQSDTAADVFEALTAEINGARDWAERYSVGL